MKDKENSPFPWFKGRRQKFLVSITTVIFFIVLLFGAIGATSNKETNSQKKWESIEANIVDEHIDKLKKDGYENITAELNPIIKIERENGWKAIKKIPKEGESLEDIVIGYYNFYAEYHSTTIDETNFLFKNKEGIDSFLIKVKEYDKTTYQIKTIKDLIGRESRQEDINNLLSSKKKAYEKAKAEAAKKAQQKKQQSSSPTKKVSYNVAELQSYAKDLVINTYGWSEYDYECLVKLWNRESGWNPNAHNKSSGAHGIPQSLPASKMASEGSDYYTNGYTQIRWGLKYIKNRYGTPSQAWSHSQRKGWY